MRRPPAGRGLLTLVAVVIVAATFFGAAMLRSRTSSTTTHSEELRGNSLADYQVLTLAGGTVGQPFLEPAGVAVGPNDLVYVADFAARQVLTVAANGAVAVLAGSGKEGVVDGPPGSASFAGPTALAVDSTGVVYVSDGPGHRIRRVDPDGDVTTIAGGGGVGLASGAYADGHGSSARFNLPAGILIAADGSLLVADKDNHCVRRVETSGDVSTFAGKCGIEGRADGDRLDATFEFPVGIASDGQGNTFVVGHGVFGIRVITPDGNVTTLAARPVRSFLSGVAVLPNGTILVTDHSASTIRGFGAAGDEVGVIGSPIDGRGNADGAAAEARFFAPTGLATRGDGIVVADSMNAAVRAAAP